MNIIKRLNRKANYITNINYNIYVLVDKIKPSNICSNTFIMILIWIGNLTQDNK